MYYDPIYIYIFIALDSKYMLTHLVISSAISFLEMLWGHSLVESL